MVLFAPAAIEGSLPGLSVVASGTVRTTHDCPLSVETATPGRSTLFASKQSSFGTYTVPSGATRTWPCRPPHVPGAMGRSTPFTLAKVYIGIPAPNVNPPSSLLEQKAVAISCEQ